MSPHLVIEDATPPRRPAQSQHQRQTRPNQTENGKRPLVKHTRSAINKTNAIIAAAGLSPTEGHVVFPSITHDSPMMQRNARMDACAEREEGAGFGVMSEIPQTKKQGRNAKIGILLNGMQYQQLRPLQLYQNRPRLSKERSCVLSLTNTTPGTAMLASLDSSWKWFPKASAYAKPGIPPPPALPSWSAIGRERSGRYRCNLKRQSFV